MHLSQTEHDHFFRLLHGLQFFAVGKLKIACSANDLESFASLALEEKAKARDAVYENPGVIEAYVRENPDGWPDSDLVIIRQWQYFAKDTYFIERHLKRHSIWIGKHNVYAVTGLTQPLEEIVPKYALPLMVEAVLLPFQGKIVFDGMFYHRSISFGGGIKRDLKEQYMIAKQNGHIIETLGEPNTDSEESPSDALLPSTDWQAPLAALEKASKAFKGEKHPIRKEAIAILKSSVKLTKAALHESPDDLHTLEKQSNTIIRALRRFQTALDRAEP